MAELGFVGLAVCVDLLVSVVRFTWNGTSAAVQGKSRPELAGEGLPQPKGILIVERDSSR
jgi:hypothetical protein